MMGSRSPQTMSVAIPAARYRRSPALPRRPRPPLSALAAPVDDRAEGLEEGAPPTGVAERDERGPRFGDVGRDAEPEPSEGSRGAGQPGVEAGRGDERQQELHPRHGDRPQQRMHLAA